MNPKPQTRIHRNAVKAWTVNALIFGLIYLIPAAIYISVYLNKNSNSNASWYAGIDWALFLLFTILGLALYLSTAILLPKLRWQRWRYDVSDKEIDMLRGIVITKRTLVPVNRIQHVDTRQGPVYRKFGLSSVTISTAATTHEIPALDVNTADELRNTISTMVRKVKHDV